MSSPTDTSKRLEKRFKEREHEYTTYKPFHILIGTFNVNNRSAPNNLLLEEWLQRHVEHDDRNQTSLPDIVAVGFQEIDTSSGAYIYDDKKKEDEWDQIVRKTLRACYKPKSDGDRFESLNSIRLMGILLFVYVRAVHMPRCAQVSRTWVPTGFMGLAGNKGGVGIRFRFYETDICFVNCHFASGEGQTQRRNDDFQTIDSRMQFSDVPSSSFKNYMRYPATVAGSIASNGQISPPSNRWWKINEHDIVFWFGDMNYRISQPNEQVRKAISELSMVPLHEKDQLRCEMKLKRVFADYFEPPIAFMPTYKFNNELDEYDTSEKLRTPSWTDRILYRVQRPVVRQKDQIDIPTIEPIDYSCARTIRFSDHRPVSGLYRVAMKYARDEKAARHIREELIRQIDREDNDSIPTIEVRPRPPAIAFHNVRYLDKMNYSIVIKNTGECPCACSICPSSSFEPTRSIDMKPMFKEPFFDCLTFTPNPPYSIECGQEVTIHICFQMKSEYAWRFGSKVNEILILHVDNGADTFMTLDIDLDMGPFGQSFSQLPPTLYDRETKRYFFSEQQAHQNDNLVEMKNDPPALYISLIECLKDRHDIDLMDLFSNDTQDTMTLLPIRDQIYEQNYDFDRFSTTDIFMILLHLLRALAEPLISRDIQKRIFHGNPSHQTRSVNIPSGASIQSHIPSDTASPPAFDMSKAVAVIIEQLKPKERNFFFRFLVFLQKSWPTPEQVKKFDHEQRNALDVCIDVLAMSMLHDHADRNQRHAFLSACLNEEKKKHHHHHHK